MWQIDISQLRKSFISSITIIMSEVTHIAQQFGIKQAKVEPLGNGIIHHTYKAASNGEAIVIQQINTNVFTKPDALVGNYLVVYQHLQQNGNIKIPMPIESDKGEWLIKDQAGKCWRATEFIDNAYSPDSVSNARAAFITAECFARFTAALQGIEISSLDVVIADFHDLSFRYQEFEEAISRAELFKAMRATHVIAELRQRKNLVEFYKSIKNNAGYPLRLMHHDCKIGNILFDRSSNEVICPIDLDTIMPGKYFSDLGDMIRTMACTESEESRNWEKIDVREDFYHAIVDGYLKGAANLLTTTEVENIHMSGILMTYMQSIRFITDFLNNDRYYKTTYHEQNLNRALNQLILLEKLEEFLQKQNISFPH